MGFASFSPASASGRFPEITVVVAVGDGGKQYNDATGKVSRTGTVSVGGAPWQRWEDGHGHVSLVRSFGRATALVGGVREVASLEELESLAGTLP